MIFFRNLDGQSFIYNSRWDVIAATNFVNPLLLPDVFEFSDSYKDLIIKQLQPSLFLFLSEKDRDSAFMKTYVDASILNREIIVHTYSDIKEGI